jgi:hypothetical protein
MSHSPPAPAPSLSVPSQACSPLPLRNKHDHTPAHPPGRRGGLHHVPHGPVEVDVGDVALSSLPPLRQFPCVKALERCGSLINGSNRAGSVAGGVVATRSPSQEQRNPWGSLAFHPKLRANSDIQAILHAFWGTCHHDPVSGCMPRADFIVPNSCVPLTVLVLIGLVPTACSVICSVCVCVCVCVSILFSGVPSQNHPLVATGNHTRSVSVPGLPRLEQAGARRPGDRPSVHGFHFSALGRCQPVCSW